MGPRKTPETRCTMNEFGSSVWGSRNTVFLRGGRPACWRWVPSQNPSTVDHDPSSLLKDNVDDLHSSRWVYSSLCLNLNAVFNPCSRYAQFAIALNRAPPNHAEARGGKIRNEIVAFRGASATFRGDVVKPGATNKLKAHPARPVRRSTQTCSRRDPRWSLRGSGGGHFRRLSRWSAARARLNSAIRLTPPPHGQSAHHDRPYRAARECQASVRDSDYPLYRLYRTS